MNLRRIDDDSGAKTTSPFLEAKSAPPPALARESPILPATGHG